MEPGGSAAAGENSAGTEPAAKVSITPRKATVPAGIPETHGSGLQLTPVEPVWARRNRICPKSPKVPFEHPPTKGVETPEALQGTTYEPRHHPRRGLVAFFRSRRKGGYRIVNFIVLPIAVLIASAAIILLLLFR